MTSKASRIAMHVQTHVLAAINLADYVGYNGLTEEPTTQPERVRALQTIFESEYGYAIKQYGTVKALREWLMGLPTACTVAFSNADIVRLGYEWGALNSSASAKRKETAEADWLDQWFERCAMQINGLFKKHTKVKH